MARNDILIDATPQEVFAVLADGRSYGFWVVGSKQIRDVDRDFPAPGSRFHHTVGFGPLKVDDHTCVLESSPPRRLRLRAKARPMGTALVTLDLTPEGHGQTRVVLTEDAADRLTALLFHPLTHLLVRGRNAESLQRLKELAEGRGPSMEQAAAGAPESKRTATR